MISFLLINVDKGSERLVGDMLLDMDEVKNVHLLFGEFDIIARVEIKDLLHLQNFVMDNIRPIKNIQRTDTLITTQ
ncbi:MAG: Lrp/AsnC ligand binding domain-containing protein [Candidatus Woesearchaeota archaeon]|nr:MAG: Lrp/AsnC ligand binding domain-containing protein [Candidatus Woesearchaeota archaeon]